MKMDVEIKSGSKIVHKDRVSLAAAINLIRKTLIRGDTFTAKPAK